MFVEQPEGLSTPAGWRQRRGERQLVGGEREVDFDRVRVGDEEKEAVTDFELVVEGKLARLRCQRVVSRVTNQDCPPGVGDRDLVRMVLAMIQRKHSDCEGKPHTLKPADRYES